MTSLSSAHWITSAYSTSARLIASNQPAPCSTLSAPPARAPDPIPCRAACLRQLAVNFGALSSGHRLHLEPALLSPTRARRRSARTALAPAIRRLRFAHPFREQLEGRRFAATAVRRSRRSCGTDACSAASTFPAELPLLKERDSPADYPDFAGCPTSQGQPPYRVRRQRVVTMISDRVALDRRNQGARTIARASE